MKLTINKRSLILPLLLIAGSIMAQPPAGISFQAVAKDPLGNPAKNRKIFVKDFILQGTITGTKVWAEAHETQSNEDGVYTITIGRGVKDPTIPLNDIGQIDWANGPFFLNFKIAVAPSIPAAWWVAADNYLEMGAAQIMSTPYALFAGKANVANIATSLKPGPNGSFLITDSSGKVDWTTPKLTNTTTGIKPGPNGSFLITDSSGKVDWTTPKLTNTTTGIKPGPAKTFLYTDEFGNVAWTTPNLVSVSITNVAKSIDPGPKGTFLTTDTLGNVAWALPQAAGINVTQVSNNLLELKKNTGTGGQNVVIAPNSTTLITMAVPDAEIGDPVVIASQGDYTNFSIYNAWVSATGIVSIRFANFQKKSIPVSGNLYKVVLIK